MDDLDMIHRLKTYQNGVHGDFFMEVAERLTSLIGKTGSVATSPAAMAGSATRLLVEKKLRLLKERYSNACNGNDHEEGIKLYAQICLLDNIWLDIIRIEGE